MPDNAAYWSQRRKELDATLVRDEAAFFETMRRYYNQEAARLDQEIAAYYAKYGEGNVIEYRRLLESLSDEDKTLLIQRTDEFVAKYPEYAHLVPTRESIYQLNRLEGLRQSIAMQQLEMGAREIADATAFFQQMVARYANGAAELLGFGGSFYTVDHALVQLVVGQSWCEGRNFSARIWDNRDALTRSLYTDLVNGMIRGDSYQRIADAMQQRFQNVSRRNIERLVFTEDTFLANEAAMQVYANDASFQEYVFVATNDSRTCDVCRALDGQQFQIKKRMPGVNFPPMHPWCRCFFDPVYGGASAVRQQAQRVTRSGGSGLTSGAESGIMKAGRRFEEYSENPSLLGESTPEEKYKSYIAQGLVVKPLGRGSFKNIPFESGGGYRVYFDDSMQKSLMYHPEKRSHHDGAYYKLSDGKYGVKRFDIRGNPIEE